MMGNKGKQLDLIIDNELKNLVLFSVLPILCICDIFQICDLSKKIFKNFYFNETKPVALFESNAIHNFQ